MAAMNMVSAGWFWGGGGLSFHLSCPQGVASVLCKKTLIFGSRRSKLDHLTVSIANSLETLFDTSLSGFYILFLSCMADAGV
jgi:hypothetical protein